jgi:uncharacterized membrane protein YeaQ/YmgE (transglycosylase-associated protein family)
LADAATTTTTTATVFDTAKPIVLPSLQSVTSMVVEVGGLHFNLMAIVLAFVGALLMILFWRIQSSEKLDFADMITKDGRAVSLTKVLQLIGGITSTWIMIKLTLTGGLTEALFGLYLTYVGAIEGYSKYVSAKYGYTEKSVKDADPTK